MVGSFLATKWPILIRFCWILHQKSKFSLISDTSSVGGCWGQPILFFWKLVDETQMVIPPEPTIHHNSKKYLILLALRAIYFRSFHYETHCKSIVTEIWVTSSDSAEWKTCKCCEVRMPLQKKIAHNAKESKHSSSIPIAWKDLMLGYRLSIIMAALLCMSLLNCNLYDMYPISDMTQDRMYNLYIVHTPFLSLLTN